MSAENRKPVEEAIGQKVAELLRLKMDRKTKRFDTTCGTKSLQGLGECITRIIEEETGLTINTVHPYPPRSTEDLIRSIQELATQSPDIFPIIDSQYYDEDEIEEGSVADLSMLIMGNQRIDEIRVDGVDTEKIFYPWDELYHEDLEYLYDEVLLPLSKATNEKE